MGQVVKLRNRSVRAGFTLLEVLVALVIFATITVALSLSFDTAFQVQVVNGRRQKAMADVRVVFDFLTRDIQQAYASSGSSAAVFLVGGSATGSQSGQTGVNGGLLTLMTRNNRIQNTASGDSRQNVVNSATDSPPQWDAALVRYDFDPQSRTLTRSVSSAPSLNALNQATPGPTGTIATNVESITLRLYDGTNQSWRTDWDYEQQNQQSSTGGTSGAGSTGASSGTGSSNSSTNSSTGDAYLPAQVEVTVVLRQEDGSQVSCMATIPVVAQTPLDTQKPPTHQDTSTATGTGSGGR